MAGMTDTTHGPGLLCRALHIDRSLNRADLLGDTLWIERPASYRAPRIAAQKRIGVDYAGEWAHNPWRFLDRDSPYVSSITAAARRKALAAVKPPARPTSPSVAHQTARQPLDKTAR
jgi:DNA-3-methyladenine glycosylase